MVKEIGEHMLVSHFQISVVINWNGFLEGLWNSFGIVWDKPFHFKTLSYQPFYYTFYIFGIVGIVLYKLITINSI